MTSIFRVVLVGPCLALSLIGQTIVVPSTYNGQEGGAVFSLPGFDSRFRQQVIVRGELLAAAKGKALTGVSVRRDVWRNRSMSAGQAQVRVAISHSARPSSAPAASFAANAGAQPVVVFDGTLSLPASPASAPGWAQDQTVSVPFTPTFAYTGGDLCLEFEGEPIGAIGVVEWPVDFVHETIGSSARAFGTSCGPITSLHTTTASAWFRQLMPGGTFRITLYGRPAAPGLLLLGAAAAQAPLDAAGAPGCVLWTQPMVVLPVVYDLVASASEALAESELPVPVSANLLNASFYAQGVELEIPAVTNAAGLFTSNGLELTFGGVLPVADVSIVTSEEVPSGAPLPGSGYVRVGFGPVMRFTWR